MILIAVALFAALSYAVTQSGGGGGTVDKETSLIQAAEITQRGALFLQTIQRMVLMGTDITELSFDYPGDIGDYTYGRPNEDKVFEAEGGNLSPDAPSSEWLDDRFSAKLGYGYWVFQSTCVPGVGTGGTACRTDGIDNEELVMVVNYIQKDICLAINKMVGISDVSGDAPQAAGCNVGGGDYRGFFYEATRFWDSVNSYLNGNHVGCFKSVTACSGGDVDASYAYYHVLYPR